MDQRFKKRQGIRNSCAVLMLPLTACYTEPKPLPSSTETSARIARPSSTGGPKTKSAGTEALSNKASEPKCLNVQETPSDRTKLLAIFADRGEFLDAVEANEGKSRGIIDPGVGDAGDAKPGLVLTSLAEWSFFAVGKRIVAVRNSLDSGTADSIQREAQYVYAVRKVPAYVCPLSSKGGCAERTDVSPGPEGHSYYCMEDYNTKCLRRGERVTVEVASPNSKMVSVISDVHMADALSIQISREAKLEVCVDSCCSVIK